MNKSTYVFPPKRLTVLSIEGKASYFPVNRIYCVGRNFAAHAREMGDNPDRDPPFFFCKDTSAVFEVPFGETQQIAYPPQTSQYEYEVELVVALNKGGRDIALQEAQDCIFGYAVGLDMTRRDLQSLAKSKGRPWEVGKSFALSAPMSPIKTKQDVGNMSAGIIELLVNDETKQVSNLTHLTWSVDEVISRLSTLFELHPGDLIMTGTPENVGPVVVGDRMTARIEGLGDFSLEVVD